MAKGPSDSQRIDDLAERVAKLERRPTRVAAGITASNLNDRIEDQIRPLNDRIRALQAILQGYELVLMDRQITSQEIANAIKRTPKWQELTPAQVAIVGDLLQSL